MDMRNVYEMHEHAKYTRAYSMSCFMLKTGPDLAVSAYVKDLRKRHCMKYSMRLS